MTQPAGSVVRLRLASRSHRCFAALIDLALLGLLGWGVEELAETFTTRWDETIALVPGFFYYWLLHARFGRTFGKWVFDMKVISPRTGRPPSLSASALRALAYWAPPLIPSVGWILVLINITQIYGNDAKQCHHDRFADTMVVYLPPSPAS
ncbi:RDD family protein [Nonomuraea sp. NN258]|uniref:RDD family protein n=1 Tax=Nonomuraea antri TaxID=2730852 RepID=UPI001569C10E|nr:RDD family protein [Nonomuraea antri]NRQ30792.1 RDD family protein [Nonomuraea antri]